MELRERLAQTRKARGLSQEELAAQVGVSRQAVSKWETGDALPDLPKLLALADTLHMSVDALCGREAAGEAPAPGEGAAEVPAPGKGAASGRPGRRRLPAVLLLLLLLCGSFFAGTRLGGRADEPSLPETLTVSGVNFFADSGGLSYQFVPSAAGEAYAYRITFKGFAGPAQTFDVPYSGGLCAGTAALDASDSYFVTAEIRSGQDSRAVPLASDLSFSGSGVSWLPAS